MGIVRSFEVAFLAPLFYFLLILLHLMLMPSPCDGTAVLCHAREREALLRFSDGLSWSDTVMPWGEGEEDNCCSWFGIRCDNRTGHIVSLDLRGGFRRDHEVDNYVYGVPLLRGKMGSSLATLKYLRRLDLSGNDFEGSSIPPLLGSLERLTYLDLSYANFSGVVPCHLGNLSNLQVLNLSDIYRIESDGEWFSLLHKLQALDLDFRHLTGTKYNLLEVLNMLPLLETLHLYFPHGSDTILLPLPNVNFTRLRELAITSVKFTNACWMSNMTNLEDIQLEFNYMQIDACRNDFTAKLCNLKSLSLWDNDMGAMGDLNRFLAQCNKRLNLLSLTSYNSFGGHLPGWLGDYKSLQALDLGGDNLWGSIPESIGGMTSLKSLGLSGKNLTGFITQSIGGLRSLEYLSLYSNSLTGSIPHSIGRLQSLEYLVISETNLSGPIPQSIGGLRSLKYLSLFNNNVMGGSIPQSIGKLQPLEDLDLSRNSLTGSIPQSIGMLQSLKSLRLYENNLTGCIPQSIGVLQSLKTLDLHDNNLMGSIPQSIGSLQSLEYLDLSVNNLSGHLPLSLWVLKSLTQLDLRYNDFQGNLSEEHFVPLINLTTLELSSNSLQVTISPHWVPPFSLDVLGLGSCKVGRDFPLWLRTQNKLWILNMSDSGISDTLPQWIWNFSSNLQFMYLSMNELKGVVPAATNSSKMEYLLLDSNLLEGSLSSLPPVATALSLSNNNFTGSIPPSFCEVEWMGYLNLANNRLSGQLPSCSANQTCGFTSLHLSSNNLHGTLPAWLGNCKEMQILDIGGNDFSGEIPDWISNRVLPLIKVLILKSNSFHGSIPMELPNMKALHVLDLADNNLSGSIPPTVCNFSAMRTPLMPDERLRGFDFDYTESTMVTFKGFGWPFESNLQILASIDLSGNKLSGDIPDGVGKLVYLINLNLSRNHLSGRIPETLSNLSHLESLDLSYNNLYGGIPQALSRLASLSTFNVSYNRLSGRIPSGWQFDTFTNSSYIGNLNLCGKPLPIVCQSDLSTPPITEGYGMKTNEKDDRYFLWLSLSVVLGFIMGFWTFLGTLFFKSNWRLAYFQLVDDQCEKYYLLAKIYMDKCRRMCQRS